MTDYQEIFEESALIEEPGERYEKSRDFVSLHAWQKCRAVKLFFYQEIIPQLPKEETYHLGSQIRRAAISITQNIAEGYGRFHYREGMQFYRIARGSLYELKDAIITCSDLNFIDQSLYERGLALIEEAKITLNGYINFIAKQIKNPKK